MEDKVEDDFRPELPLHGPPEKWTERDIDNFMADEKVYMGNAYVIYTTEKLKKVILARQCEDLFRTISNNANKIGMSVNQKKTQMVRISAANSYNAQSFITTPTGEQIWSGPSMKILGFCFGEGPNVNEHVEQVIRKYNKRAWFGAQRLINLETPVLVRSLKSSNVELG